MKRMVTNYYLKYFCYNELYINKLNIMEFNKNKQVSNYNNNYLRILNELNEYANNVEFKPKILAKAANISKSSVSLFLNNKQENYNLLQTYANLLGYKISFRLEKIKLTDLLFK